MFSNKSNTAGGRFGNKHREESMSATQKAAAGLAVLATMLMTPQIWEMAGWLTDQVFSSRLDDNPLLAMRGAIFVTLTFISYQFGKVGLSSAIAVMMLSVLARLPIL